MKTQIMNLAKPLIATVASKRSFPIWVTGPTFWGRHERTA